MKAIRTAADLRSVSNSLPKPYIQRLVADFSMLQRALADGESLDEFSLQDHGYLVILENGDDVRDLSEVGLNPEDEGLLGSMPEYVETLSLGDNLQVYKIAVLYDNDYMMFFYSQVGIHDEEVEEWLREQAVPELKSSTDSSTVPF